MTKQSSLYQAFKQPQASVSNSMKKELIRLQRTTKFLQRIEVKNWRDSHQEAIDLDNPKYEGLMEVYEDAMLDPHLRSVTQARTLNVLNTAFNILDEVTQEPDDSYQYLDKMWFYNFMKDAHQSLYYGYTPLEFHFDQGSDLSWEVSQCKTFYREHVIPQWRAIVPDVNGTEKLYIDEPPYNNNFLLINAENLGLLLQCARYTIFKKYSINHWSKFQDVFGIPGRVAKTDSRDEEVLDMLEHNLREMGASMSMIAPFDSEFEIFEASNTDAYNVFLEAANLADSQVSKIILGQTMTTDNGSSRSQSEVHERKENSFTKSDLRFIEHVINGQLFPFLIKWGYPLEGKVFKFDQSNKLPLAKSQLEIDTWISQNFDIEEDYIERTYGTPVEGRKQFSNTIPNNGDSK